MRAIKFRAWDKEKKVMVYDNDTDWRDTYPVSVTNKGIIFCDKGRWGVENEVKDEDGRVGYQQWEYDKYYQNVELMEWTGFVDQVGTEIYEGDIVRFQEGKMHPKNLLVHWQNVGWEPFNSYSDIFRSGYKPEHHLVMGNIYKNPEIEYERKGL